MVLLISRTCPTSPAELVMTEGTRHVIATLVFFDSSAAHWAERDITGIVINPALQLLVHSLFACNHITVPVVSTLEAD